MNIDPTLPKPLNTASTANIVAYQLGYLAGRNMGASAENPYSYAKLHRFSAGRELYKQWIKGHQLGLSQQKSKEATPCK